MSMEFYNQTTPVAKKPHKCIICGEEIKVGERYSCEAVKAYREEFYTTKIHLGPCWDYYQEFLEDLREQGEYEFEWGWIRDWWHEAKCATCVNANEEGDCIADCGRPDHVNWCGEWKETNGGL
jgi:hypothetical protein